MFRHMPVPRDTLVSRQIIIVCCESVGNCQTLSNSMIFRPFVLSLRPMSIVSYPFCPVPTCAHQRVLHNVFMFINRQLFI